MLQFGDLIDARYNSSFIMLRQAKMIKQKCAHKSKNFSKKFK